MIFNSINFFIFFIMTLIIYYVVKSKYRYLVLLASSYFFYGCSNIKNIIVLFFVTIISYLAGLFINKADNQGKKKIALLISIVLIIGTLSYFKYLSFIISNINAIFSKNIIIENLIVPLGISFFTLQAITYIVDSYRKDVKLEKNFFRYACFLSFFPCILSGPILKSKELLSQFNEEHRFDYSKFKIGFFYIVLGLFKKICLADLIAVGVNNVYNNLHDFSGLPLLIIVILYSFQIYFDFSSYSNIAYGCAKLLGFDITKNFESPYFADSIKNFWSKWHIALSTWLKDYIYIPLGGNRKGKLRTYLNLIIVFIVSGLWHGAAWTYIIWGFLHSIYQVIERIINKNFKLKFVNVAITFTLVTIAWIFFRANNINDVFYILTNMFKLNFSNIVIQMKSVGFDKFDYLIILLLTSTIMLLEYLNIKHSILESFLKKSIIFRIFIYLSIFLIIIIFGHYGPEFSNSQFIYLGF